MFGKQPRFKYAFLVFDASILTISFFFSFNEVFPGVWYTLPRNWYFFFDHLIFCFFLLCIYLPCFKYNGLYHRNIVSTRYRQFVLITKSLIFGGIASVLFMVISNLKYFYLYGKNLIFDFLLLSFVLLTVFRAILGRELFLFLAKKKILTCRVLIVGGDEAGKRVRRALEDASLSDFVIVGFLDDYKNVGQIIDDSFVNLGKLENLDEIVDKFKVDEIIVAIDNAPYLRLIHVVDRCLHTGKAVRVYSNILQVIAEKLNVELYGGIPVINLSQYAIDDPALWGKRIFDIILSAVSLVLLSPLFFLIGVGIKLSSKGPVIYKQVRIGYEGRPFNFYKFRSMHVNNDHDIHKEYVTNFIKNKDHHENKKLGVFKITDDPRIFKFGRFIRKTSLDELPQLYNVLKKDMSLVGPRPCLPYEWECYSDWHKMRLNVIPGCTGLWQVVGRSAVSFEEMVILDLYYISNMTAWLDLMIILKTFPVVFLAKGAH